MGIYLPNMEMPRFGYREIRIHPDGMITERPDPEYPCYEECLGKAVPIPPHGRLIDADALGIRDAEKQAYEAYLKEKDKFYVEGSWIEYMQGRLDGLNDAYGRVRFAPTIIPAEEGET